MSSADMLVIERMRADDLEAATALMAALGYDIPPDELRARFATIARRDDHAVFVARRDGRTLGLVHVYVRAALEKPVEAVVQSLVVDASERRGGIGQALNREAEDWARMRGLSSIALYTQMERDDAVRFYVKEGYAEANRSRLMRKPL